MSALPQAEGGEKVADICRNMSISQATVEETVRRGEINDLRELRPLRDGPRRRPVPSRRV